MAAVHAALVCQLPAGDKLVASRALFGSCHYIISELLPRFGVETHLVDGTDYHQWEAAIGGDVTVTFFESPSNPTLEIIDIKRVAELTHTADGKLIVDNALASPVVQKPLALGADVVVYSATKHIDGQGAEPREARFSVTVKSFKKSFPTSCGIPARRSVLSTPGLY